MIVTIRQLNAALDVAKRFPDVAPDGLISFCEETIETLLSRKLNDWDFENEDLALVIINTAKVHEETIRLNQRR